MTFEPLRPGLLILHGNRLEHLAEAVFSWLAGNPLAPLEEECFLVQSNGMAEWLKIELASAHGICAATRVELPARFVWRAYRAVLGRSAVPTVSPLDKLPLTWRLMGLLPQLMDDPVFAPVAGFLHDGDPGRRLQLAQRLADLFDQYQVYRSDWLADWAGGRDRLRSASDAERAPPVPADQLWQPALWRAALERLTAAEREATRPALHRRFVETLATADASWPRLPRRIVLFGTTHVAQQTLEAVTALAQHSQVLMAVPNPCRYHWADIIDGRELLRSAPRRHGLRGGRDLAAVPLQDMHAHGHPLLAAWGRQGRDFVRQLDAFDDVQQAQARFQPPRVDLFDDGDGANLLQQVQARIRDLVPLAEHVKHPPAAGDRSIVFHVAHSAQREVEILHDQLLHLFAEPPDGQPLNPRDVVVMVPDIDSFAPAIRSVFGQHARGHERFIPWGIADQRDRGHHPLLVALEWLLNAPRQRLRFSELRDLLDVPAVARCFGITAEDLPILVAWIAGAGIRWGLDEQHRQSLGLQACGGANSWRFGLRRMLLGYATGELSGAPEDGFAGIEPYAEVAGLSAGLAGALAELLDRIDAWWTDAMAARPPAAWGSRLRTLLQQVFVATDVTERALLAVADEGLSDWLQACEQAAFDADVELDVVREAWLAAIDEPGVSQRFKAGGVTFCTLLPMRAIPFDAVCLLGMNDGDYPRRSARSDFDLMALPGQARPGDRSRRDDDRQLMLDALLSARRVLYVSWAGRSQRDNQLQPPSVLVSQLQDYLVAGWGLGVVRERTTEHPLQPFSRRYFEPGAAAGGLWTYASEWRATHADVLPGVEPAAVAIERATIAPIAALDIAGLARFLRNPVKAFFRQRLQVSFFEFESEAEDDEVFVGAGLERWRWLDDAIRGVRRQIDAAGPLETAALGALVQAQLARLERAGRLPMAGPGRIARSVLARTLVPMLARWQALQADYPRCREKQPLRLVDAGVPGLEIDDWLVGLRSNDGDARVWIELQAGNIADKAIKAPRSDKLLSAWVRCLASAACGHPAGGILIGADAVVHVAVPPQPEATETLLALMRSCHDGLRGDRPLPTAVLTGLAFVKDGDDRARPVYQGSDFGAGLGENREPCLARLYPDYASLRAEADFEPATRQLYEPYRDWLDAHVRVEELPDHATGGDADDE